MDYGNKANCLLVLKNGRSRAVQIFKTETVERERPWGERVAFVLLRVFRQEDKD